MNRQALLLVPLPLVAGVQLLPEVLPSLLGGAVAAWYYVLFGVESAALWGFVFFVVWNLRLGGVLVLVPLATSAWAFIESAERAVCRVLLPMDKPPPKGPICDAVFGFPVSVVGMIAALFIALLAMELQNGTHR